ncbi:MAG: IS66 family insertion sequence element accessory protein TnpB [Reinekea sp.]
MNPDFRPSIHRPRIYLYRDTVDFRKSFRGLAALIEQELGHNPFDGDLYVFTNRQYNKIKCLFWERNGFVLYYKSLAEEKFHWPRQSDELEDAESNHAPKAAPRKRKKRDGFSEDLPRVRIDLSLNP